MKDSERLQLIITHLLLSKNAFAKSIGVSSDTIYNILTDKTSITANLVKKITDTYQNVRPEWLLKGEGTMLMWQEPDKILPLPKLEEPPLDYPTLKQCYAECQAEVARLRAKLDRIENEGCLRCAEKDKSIARLYDLLKDWSSGASRDYRAPDKALDTG